MQLGLTAASRIWRLTFERPFAVKARDQNLKLKHEAINDIPSPCCFSERSEWIDDFIFGQPFQFFTPTHYIFNLIDNFVEIMRDDSPTVEEIANEASLCGSLSSVINAEKMSRLRQGSGATAPKDFGPGGKGIRTPDFQLAKLALYQLSYAPGEVSILGWGSRIANLVGGLCNIPV
jgi:hypothetical protein